MISLDHLSKDERKFYHKLLKMSPNELAETLSNKKLQKDFVVSAISVAFESKDIRLFVRLWVATPKPLQNYAVREFDKFDVPLLDIVEAFQAAVAFEDSMSECFSDNPHSKSRNAHRDQDHNDNFDEKDSQEPGFENYPGQGKSHGRGKTLSPEQELHMKSLYRKLVRWLHPDANVQPDDHQHWQKAIWYELQQCYQNKDLVGLEQIYWVTNLRSQNLSALTIDEIKKGAEVFSNKLDSIHAKIRSLKKDPAWGFSIKNDHTKLKQKIAKDLSAQIAPTQERIQELRDYHAFLKHALPRPKSRRRRR